MQKEEAIFDTYFKFFMTRDILGKELDISFNTDQLKNKTKALCAILLALFYFEGNIE